MTTFSEQGRASSLELVAGSQAAFVRTVQLTRDSIVDGSAITASPGQPVGQYGPGYQPGKVGGTLKASWQTEFLSPTEAIIATNVPYAQPIEDGIGPHGDLTLRSTVGGFHSVKQTVAGFPLIVEEAVREVTE